MKHSISAVDNRYDFCGMKYERVRELTRRRGGTSDHRSKESESITLRYVR